MRTSGLQFQLLVEFMDRYGDLSKPTEGPQGRICNMQLWAQLTDMLNADSTGDTKSAEKWRKVWSDMKNNTKKKAARIHRDAIGTGGGPASKLKLTDLELRVLNIVGPQAATGMNEIGEVGLYQEDMQPISASEMHSEIPEATENTFAMWSRPGTSASAQPAPLPQDEIEPPPPPMASSNRSLQSVQVQMVDIEVPIVEDTPPIAEAPQLPTPLPATPRRTRRLLQATSSPSRRRTRTQTQSELARQAFVNSDNEWRVFQQKCEEERLRLRERELQQQERWLDLFAQFIVLGNRIVDTYQK